MNLLWVKGYLPVTFVFVVQISKFGYSLLALDNFSDFTFKHYRPFAVATLTLNNQHITAQVNNCWGMWEHQENIIRNFVLCTVCLCVCAGAAMFQQEFKKLSWYKQGNSLKTKQNCA